MNTDTGKTPEQETAEAWAEFEQQDKAAATPDLSTATTDGAHTTTGTDGAAASSTTTADGTSATGPDIWADAPEHLRNAYFAERERAEKLEHAERSNRPRIAALQRNIENLKAQAAAQASEAPKISELLEPLRSDYSEVSEPIERALSSVEERLAQTEESRRQAAQAELTHHQRELEQLVDTEAAAVEAAHPGWQQFIGSRHEEFTRWADDQPRVMREAIIRNGEFVIDGAETAEIVSSFKAFLDGNPSATGGNPPPSTSDRRQRQLAGSSSTHMRGNGRPTVSGVPDTASAADHWRDMEARGIAM